MVSPVPLPPLNVNTASTAYSGITKGPITVSGGGNSFLNDFFTSAPSLSSSGSKTALLAVVAFVVGLLVVIRLKRK